MRLASQALFRSPLRLAVCTTVYLAAVYFHLSLKCFSDRSIVSFYLPADALSFTSALSVTLALLAVCTTVYLAGVTVYQGHATMPRWLPDEGTGLFTFFSILPVVANAFICHYNGEKRRRSLLWLVSEAVLILAGLFLGRLFFFRSS